LTKSPTVSQLAVELADREAIRHCLMRYCRGIDRLDRELLDSVYWPDATDDHIIYSGNASGFINFVIDVLSQLDQTQHLVGNVLIDMSGPDMASSESVFQAFHRLPGAVGASDLFVGGRYVDRLEKRNDEWRILARTVIIDWFRSYQDSGEFSEKPMGMDTQPGGRKPDDPSYSLMALHS
jgi:hypothetical protein